MDHDHFDALTRLFGATASRRNLGHALAGGSLGALLSSAFGAFAAANQKSHKKKLRKNAFGCLDVGKPCAGKDGKCCSGVCQGKKPKKGEKDKSTCVAHNMGGCTPERDFCRVGGLASLCNPEAACLATTGNAGFCGSFVGASLNNCQPCRKDKDCEAAGFGAGAACVIFDGGFCASPDTCAGINGSTGTACFPPGA